MSRDPARHPQEAPSVGFIGWGPESEAVLSLLRARHPGIEAGACALAAGGVAAPVGRVIASAEGLFASARVIFAEGGDAALEPHLPLIRLAISDRHILALLGPGWSLEALLKPLHERKLVRCALLPTQPGRGCSLAYFAAPFFAPGELEGFKALLGGLELSFELKQEGHFEVLQALADFAPAALATVMDAMADGVVMMGLSRAAALRFIAALAQGAATRILNGEVHPAALREQALEHEVAAAGLVELESAGIRGTVIRSIQQTVRRARPAERPSSTEERD